MADTFETLIVKLDDAIARGDYDDVEYAEAKGILVALLREGFEAGMRAEMGLRFDMSWDELGEGWEEHARDKFQAFLTQRQEKETPKP